MKNVKLFVLGTLVLSMCMSVPAMSYSLLTEKLEDYPVGPTHPEGIYMLGMTVYYNLRLLNTHTMDTANFAAGAIVDIEPGGSPSVPLNAAAVSLAPDAQWTDAYQYIIVAGDIVPGGGGTNVVINTLQATGTQGLETFTSTGTQTVQVVDPSIDVIKEADVDVSKVGDTINYTITVINDGDWPIVPQSVIDNVLGDLSASFTNTLAPAESESHSFPYIVQGGDPDPLVNTVVATYLTQDFDAAIVGATVSDTATDSVDLVVVCIEIDKTVEPQVSKVGDEVVYTICINNCGEHPLENIVVTDPLLGGTLPGFPGTMDPEDPPVCLTFPYVIQTGDPDPLVNTARVDSDPEGPMTNPVNDEDGAEVDLVEPAICITKTVDNPNPCYGDTVTYTICIDNCGDYPLENIVVTDPHLGGVLAGFPGTMDPEDPPACVQFPYVVQETDPCPLVNTARVDADPEGPMTNPINDEDPAEICPEPCGGEGCTPGFWKNNADKHGASAWEGYSPGDDFSDVFGIPEQVLRDKGKDVFSNPTLLQALNANGGGINALARHATAALLNITSGCVEYAIGDVDTLKSMVQAAIAGGEGDIQDLHHLLAGYNEAGCPVNQHGECSNGT